MTNKFKFLFNNSLKKKIKSKSFLITNIILFILIVGLINIDSIIKYFGGDFDETTTIYMVDNTNEFYDSFNTLFSNISNYGIEEKNVKLEKSTKTKEELTKEIKEKQKDNIIIEVNRDNETLYNINVLTYEYIDALLYQNILNTANNTKVNLALQKSNIDKQELDNIYKEITATREFISEDVNENEELIQTLSQVIIPIFIIPFFILIILVIQMIGAEINEEKSSKSMEIIITSVSPKTHFLSKVCAVNIFVLIQSLLFVGYLTVGLVIRKIITKTAILKSFGGEAGELIHTFIKSGMASNILKLLPLIIILFILSFIAYTLFAGILASMTTSMEDYQQLQTPIMIVVMIGYYLAIMASVYEGSLLIKICSVVPFISAILAPVLLILGQIGLFETLLSIGLLVLVILFFTTYGMRIYKSGILNYTSSKLWTKMFKSMKKTK